MLFYDLKYEKLVWHNQIDQSAVFFLWAEMYFYCMYISMYILMYVSHLIP